MEQYHNLVKHILNSGTRKENRTGVDTISCFGYHYSHHMDNGFPLLTTKKVSWKNILVENLWFLSGNASADFLHRHGCHFWDPWLTQDNKVPSGYGYYWRHFFENDSYDQIKWAYNQLCTNPMSRRLVVNAWHPKNVREISPPACHLLYIFNVQHDENGEKELCLHLTQRSADVAIGVPYNLAGYTFILCLMGHLTGIKPGWFSHTLVDAHIYTSKPDGTMGDYDHIPGLWQQVCRQPKPLPKLEMSEDIRNLEDVEELIQKAPTKELLEKFQIKDYDPHPRISFKVAV